ncbi:MAG: hypothetical protein ABI718_11765 [Acidobacteriota bacterium]
MSRLNAVVVLSMLLSAVPAVSAERAGADSTGPIESESFTSGPATVSSQTRRTEAAKEIPTALVEDARFRGMLNILWKASRFGTTCEERGAWIIRDADGSYSCLQVPVTHQCDELSFSPLRPLNAVAFVHTHPNRSSGARDNDLNDQLAAHRIGLPMYTLHRLGVWKYDPHTGITGRELGALGWQKGLVDARGGCPVMGPATRLSDGLLPPGVPMVVVKNAP